MDTEKRIVESIVLRPNLWRAALVQLPLFLVIIVPQLVLYRYLPALLIFLPFYLLTVLLRRRDWVEITDRYVEGPRGWGLWARRRIGLNQLNQQLSGWGRFRSVKLWSVSGECVVLGLAFAPGDRLQAVSILGRPNAI